MDTDFTKGNEGNEERRVGRNEWGRNSQSFGRFGRCCGQECPRSGSVAASPLGIAIVQIVRKLRGFSGCAMSREAFGVRGACSRFRARLVIESAGKPGRTPNASRRSIAALPLCVYRVSVVDLLTSGF